MSVVTGAALGAAFQALMPIFSEALKCAKLYMVTAPDIEMCRTMFMDIEVFLQDAEHKQFTDHFVKGWLDDLEDLAHDAEGILESFNYKVLRRQIMERDDASSSIIVKIKSKVTNLKDKIPKLNNKFKNILNRLQVMTERKTTLDLYANNITVSNSSSRNWSRDPGSFLPEHGMKGRETERERIVKLLLDQERRFEVIAIVGMGGIGKSTLAQSIFNDSEIIQHFCTRSWVHVSKSFDMKRITKAIFESVTLQPCQFDDINVIKIRISEVLREKMFLLVLDDLWDYNDSDWSGLLAMLSSKGIKVVVTTRNTNVPAKIRSCIDSISLDPLSYEHSWEIFCYYSGFSSSEISNTEFEEIGGKIVEKCSGLPLAVMSIGSVLRNKETEEEWEAVLDDIMSNSNEREDNIMPILRTSYYDLASDLKRCFLFCALFPEDTLFVGEIIIPEWMGLGLIPNEEKGHSYFQQLVARSMFFPAGILYSEKNEYWRERALEFYTGSCVDKNCFRMHHLIREMGQQISGNLFSYNPLNVDSFQDIMKRTRHVSLKMESLLSVENDLFSLNKIEPLRLRSFMAMISHSDLYQLCWGKKLSPTRRNEYTVVDNLFHKLKYLRVLCLHCYPNSELPESVGRLRLLRYMDLSGSSIIRLPKSTTTLHNLEILILRFCVHLKELPPGIGNLVKLCYLDITKSTKLLYVINGIDKYDGIEQLPHGIEKLVKLRRLSDFIIRKDEGKQIECLKNLNLLRGELRIIGLSNLTSSQDAKLAQLDQKKLNSLVLDGTFNKGTETTDFEVMEQLRPHSDLRELYLRNYYGQSCFPSWIEIRSLKHLKHLELYNSDKCTTLPSIGSFPYLEVLVIERMHALIEVGLDWYGKSYRSSFRKLKNLTFRELNEWEKWIPCHQIQFPDLCELGIYHCPKLSGDMSVLKTMPSLKNLKISCCENLDVFLPMLPRLKSLHLSRCKYVVCSEECDLHSLEVFELSFNFDQYLHLSNLIESRLSSRMFIEKIRDGMIQTRCLTVGHNIFFGSNNDPLFSDNPRWELDRCYMVVDQDQQPDESMVHKLKLCNQPFEHLPSWICKSNVIRHLRIENCSLLKTFSPTGDFPSSLDCLQLSNCPELTSPWNDGNLPSGLTKLQIMRCPILMQKLPEILHKFTSLRYLTVGGITIEAWKLMIKCLPNLTFLQISSSPGIVSFPSVKTREECFGLQSLTYLGLFSLPDLKNLSFLAMESLSCLDIQYCPVLEKLFEEELPLSIQTFRVKECPKVKEILNSVDDQLRRKISHITYIIVDDKPVCL